MPLGTLIHRLCPTVWEALIVYQAIVRDRSTDTTWEIPAKAKDVRDIAVPQQGNDGFLARRNIFLDEGLLMGDTALQLPRK